MFWYFFLLNLAIVGVIGFYASRYRRRYKKTIQTYCEIIDSSTKQMVWMAAENTNLRRRLDEAIPTIVKQAEDIRSYRSSYVNLQKAYIALEIGRDEQDDNYEQQFVEFEERVAEWREREELLLTAIVDLEEQHKFHEDHCLPVLTHMREAISKPKPEMLDLARMRLLVEQEFPGR